MKIVRFSAENIKRLKAVSVTPEGELVVVGGKNDAGKSSLLDAIEMAMAGEARTPAQPVRRGEKDGRIVLDLGDYVVKRSYTAAGGRKLVVENKDGARFPSPQALLDRLYSDFSFDPLAFERMERKAQAETLRKLVGLDLSVLDGQRARLYEERTERNRDVRALEVRVETLDVYEGVPAEEVSIAGIAEELAAAERAQRAAGAEAGKVRSLESKRQITVDRRQAAENEKVHIQKRLAELEEALDEADASLSEQAAEIAAATLAANAAHAAVPDTAAIRGRLAETERVNVQVRHNRHRAEAERLLEDAQADARKLTDRIDGVDAQRLERLAAVTFPVEGLGIDDEGVTLGGLPFDQASTSDQIRVSVALGLAANPTLRVLLVRDGSLLGPEKLALLAEMAAKADCQVWLEMLQEAPDARTAVFIEDGSVKPRGKFALKPLGAGDGNHEGKSE